VLISLDGAFVRIAAIELSPTTSVPVHALEGGIGLGEPAALCQLPADRLTLSDRCDRRWALTLGAASRPGYTQADFIELASTMLTVPRLMSAARGIASFV
jgi:hypothetical protein